jgi:hypothetical protein
MLNARLAHDARRIRRILEISEVDMRRVYAAVVAIAVLACAALAAPAAGQTTTYHLHKEASAVTYSFLQLKTSGPDAASVARQTNDLKNLTGQWPIAYAIRRSPSTRIRKGSQESGSISDCFRRHVRP